MIRPGRTAGPARPTMPARLPSTSLFALALAPTIACAAPGASLTPPWLPADPGMATCNVGPDGAALRNAAVAFTVSTRDGALQPASLVNGYTAQARALHGELFAVMPRNGTWIGARKFVLEGPLRCARVPGSAETARAADRRDAVTLEATLHEAGSGLAATWRAQLRDGANYVREDVTFRAPRELDIARLSMIELDLPGATVAGTVSGSPIVAGDEFFGFAHPMSESQVLDGHAQAFLRRVLPLRAGVSVAYEALLGVAPRAQLRRGFQACLENERATPFRTFLHYNSWFDIGYFTPYTEREALDVIRAYGQQLVHARGVKMDSFLFDDGWDDHVHLWQFSQDFPQGFARVRAAAQALGAGPGLWLSPWGGYGPPREERLKAARAAGYEVDEQGLALSGPSYYPLFHDTTLKLLRTDGINHFKLDGTGSPDKVTPGSLFDSDFAAALALMGDLRAVKPDLFINLTTGTWPSPWWLLTADSIWRDGEDTGFTGTGTNRQRWITYRDAYTYGGIVRLGPLFPLNSVMLHGIVYARKAKGLDADPGHDFADEVRSYFATGTGLQELYVSPDKLSPANWDDLAAAARWARNRAAVLRDSHWIGGDPALGQVYGWAAWMPGHGVIGLRNPSGRPQAYELDAGEALELPADAPRHWRATPVYTQGPETPLQAGRPARVELAPYEVRVWDLLPADQRGAGGAGDPGRPAPD